MVDKVKKAFQSMPFAARIPFAFMLFMAALLWIGALGQLLGFTGPAWPMMLYVPLAFVMFAALLLHSAWFPANGTTSIPRSKFMIHLSGAGCCLLLAVTIVLTFLREIWPGLGISEPFCFGLMIGFVGLFGLILIFALIDAGGVNPLIDQVCNIRTYRDRHPKPTAIPDEPDA